MTNEAPPAAAPAAPARGKVRYAIDVRLFLATITTAMAMAFGVGVAFGPSAPSPLTPVNVDHIPAGAAGVVDSVEDILDEHGRKVGVQKVRRLPTAHSNELGDKVDLHESHVNFETPSLEDLGNGAVLNAAASDKPNRTAEEATEEHQPAGQHLLVDIKHVDASFLNSEERLAAAMVEAVIAGGLTLLSYHCHSLQPAGVSCVGVLLESHVSFHTWPDEGVITLDLFTCGSKPLLPVVSTLERLFGVPRAAGPKPEAIWSHELRGFRHSDQRRAHYLDGESDLAFWVVSPIDVVVKKEIVSVETPYQRIDIWDVLDDDDTPGHAEAVKYGLGEGDPRWLTHEIVMPERLLFLDGTLQSLSESEREYHEALVHPAMFAHPSPRRVAIVGGGEGATLREVLKHNTVIDATMIEIDEMMVDIAKQYLPKMSDCSDLVGRAASCFEDDIATIVYEDGRQWFVDRYGESKMKDPPSGGEKFDVIIMDALDPEEPVEIAEKLYGDRNFLSSLYASLSDNGVLAIQVGTAPSIHDPKPDMGVYARRETLFNLLESHPSSAAMFVYEEAHCGFNEPHSFLVVCKDAGCRERWYAESDSIDYQIYERIVDTKGNETALVHFDGSTQRSYHVPPKAWETVYCRREPKPFECDYISLDMDRELHYFKTDGDEPSSFRLEYKEDEEGEVVETSVFATVDIPKGSYIMPDHLASSFIISDKSVSNLKANTEMIGMGQVTVIENMLEFIDDYGHPSFSEGSGTNIVEIGASYMIREVDDESDANVGRWMPAHPSGKIPVYSPVYERHMRSYDVFLVATKDIKVGEEVLKPGNLWD